MSWTIPPPTPLTQPSTHPPCLSLLILVSFSHTQPLHLGYLWHSCRGRTLYTIQHQTRNQWNPPHHHHHHHFHPSVIQDSSFTAGGGGPLTGKKERREFGEVVGLEFCHLSRASRLVSPSFTVPTPSRAQAPNSPSPHNAGVYLHLIPVLITHTAMLNEVIRDGLR